MVGDVAALVVDGIAAVRLARLVADDEITAPLRAEIVAAASSRDTTVGQVAGFVLQVIPCPWCLGVWTALAVVAARTVAPRWGGAVVRALAAAEVAGRIRSADLSAAARARSAS